MRESFFTRKQLNKSVHADEAVAHEAAWLATKLGGYEVYPLIQSLVLMDVTLDSLRIDHAVDPRFSDENNKHGADEDNQCSCKFPVYKQEQAMTNDQPSEM